MKNSIARWVGRTALLLMVGTLDLASLASAQGWSDSFTSSTLDPAWEVRQTYPGGSSRPTGYTSPANRYSLTDSSLRYIVEPMTHADGFITGYQSDSDHSCCLMDPGLELHRLVSGENWIIQSKGTFYLPISNGRGFKQRVYFGDGGAGTYIIDITRGADGTSSWLGFQLDHTTGPNGYTSRTNLAWRGVTLDYNIALSTFYFRIQRVGGILTVQWSADGSIWTTAFTHDLGTALNGLTQRFVLAGYSWFYPAGSYVDWDYVTVTRPMTYRLPFVGGNPDDARCIYGRPCYPITNGPGCGHGQYKHDRWDEEAIDFALPIGSEVIATEEGVVTFAGDGTGSRRKFGTYVVLKHPDGNRSYYLHLSSYDPALAAGVNVSKGQRIGWSGTSGTRSPHLHFQINDSLEGPTQIARTLPGITWYSDPFECKTSSSPGVVVPDGEASGPPLP